jgi:hypothetical protein
MGAPVMGARLTEKTRYSKDDSPAKRVRESKARAFERLEHDLKKADEYRLKSHAGEIERARLQALYENRIKAKRDAVREARRHAMKRR